MLTFSNFLRNIPDAVTRKVFYLKDHTPDHTEPSFRFFYFNGVIPGTYMTAGKSHTTHFLNSPFGHGFIFHPVRNTWVTADLGHKKRNIRRKMIFPCCWKTVSPIIIPPILSHKLLEFAHYTNRFAVTCVQL